jgi:hypothetical protein
MVLLIVVFAVALLAQSLEETKDESPRVFRQIQMIKMGNLNLDNQPKFRPRSQRELEPVEPPPLIVWNLPHPQLIKEIKKFCLPLTQFNRF